MAVACRSPSHVTSGFASETATFRAARLLVWLGGRLRPLLTSAVGPAMAKDLTFTARVFDAQEALRIGLVNRLLPAKELQATAIEYAVMIAANSPDAIRACEAGYSILAASPTQVSRRRLLPNKVLRVARTMSLAASVQRLQEHHQEALTTSRARNREALALQVNTLKDKMTW